MNAKAKAGLPKCRKATPDEMQSRVLVVYELLARSATKGDIKRVMLSKYGLGYRQVERLIRQAKAAMIDESGKSKQELLAESLAFYSSILKSSATTTLEKIRARERIDSLFGLNAPQAISAELSGPNGSPLLAGVKLYLPEKQPSPVIDASVIAPQIPEKVNGERNN